MTLTAPFVETNVATMSRLANRFCAAMDSLAALFGRGFIAERADRLEEIFAVTKQAWERNLSRLEAVPVRHLLIAEAALYQSKGSHEEALREQQRAVDAA